MERTILDQKAHMLREEEQLQKLKLQTIHREFNWDTMQYEFLPKKD